VGIEVQWAGTTPKSGMEEEAQACTTRRRRREGREEKNINGCHHRPFYSIFYPSLISKSVNRKKWTWKQSSPSPLSLWDRQKHPPPPPPPPLSSRMAANSKPFPSLLFFLTLSLSTYLPRQAAYCVREYKAFLKCSVKSDFAGEGDWNEDVVCPEEYDTALENCRGTAFK